MSAAGSDASQKDPDPIYGTTIVVTPGCEPFYIDVQTKYPDLDLTYFVPNDMTEFVSVDQNGLVTMLTEKPGVYYILVRNQETEEALSEIEVIYLTIERMAQTVEGPDTIKHVFGTSLTLSSYTAKTPLSYRSDTKDVATVNADGVVSFIHPGKAEIVVLAGGDDYYDGGGKLVTITSQLGKPKLTAKAGKKKIKLSWNQVLKTQKYLIYCKYPGKSKFKLVTKKGASVKSVTHKKLKRGKKYTYKLRVYAEIKGKKYYGPYSDPVTVKPR